MTQKLLPQTPEYTENYIQTDQNRVAPCENLGPWEDHPSLVSMKARTTMVSAKTMVAARNNRTYLIVVWFLLSSLLTSISLSRSLTLLMSESFEAWTSLLLIFSNLARLLFPDVTSFDQIKPVIFHKRIPT